MKRYNFKKSKRQADSSEQVDPISILDSEENIIEKWFATITTIVVTSKGVHSRADSRESSYS